MFFLTRGVLLSVVWNSQEINRFQNVSLKPGRDTICREKILLNQRTPSRYTVVRPFVPMNKHLLVIYSVTGIDYNR